jgi:hypothetical protein
LKLESEKSLVPLGVCGFDVLVAGDKVRTVRTSEASWMLKWRERFGLRAGSKVGDGTLESHHSCSCSSWEKAKAEVGGSGPLRQARAELRCSDRRRSWPEMKGADVDWPVQRVTSMMSRESLR